MSFAPSIGVRESFQYLVDFLFTLMFFFIIIIAFLLYFPLILLPITIFGWIVIIYSSIKNYMQNLFGGLWWL